MIETHSLLLRKWKKSDLDPFAAMNRCKHVSEYLPKPLSREESDEFAEKIISRFAEDGLGLFAVERKDNGEFIGFNGLNIPRFSAHFMPAIEIGWRISYKNWGQGFATQSAKAVCSYAFNSLNVKEIVAFTTLANVRSRRVMEKIGMTHNPKDDFDHPNLLNDDQLKRHVLYRLLKK
ncbi:MAG: GNAT family N-acetyltransferase [Magnetococcales bacterium]|nr:GNAT family N-acetyltransferase [Magnetococcales bacterium]